MEMNDVDKLYLNKILKIFKKQRDFSPVKPGKPWTQSIPVKSPSLSRKTSPHTYIKSELAKPSLPPRPKLKQAFHT